MENASYRYTLKDIKKKIVKLQKENHWEFIFMGANIDAYGVAGSIGIGKKRTVNYQNDDRGIKLNYEVMSDVAAEFIKSQEIDDDWHESIDQDFKSRR